MRLYLSTKLVFIVKPSGNGGGMAFNGVATMGSEEERKVQ